MAKGQHKSDKEQYSAYKVLDKRQKNREARLKRHAKNHPNDKQVESVKDVKPFKVKSHTKGNFPDAKNQFTHPITGQPIAETSFAAWEGVYDPIPPKRKGKRA